MRDDSPPPRSPAGRRRSSTRDAATRSGVGRATIVDPVRFAAEVDDDIHRRRSGGPNAAVVSIGINGISDLRGRFGALFVFDVVSDLVWLLHGQLRPGDVYCVGEDGHVVLIGRGHAIEETTTVVRGTLSRRRESSVGRRRRGPPPDGLGGPVDARRRRIGGRGRRMRGRCRACGRPAPDRSPPIGRRAACGRSVAPRSHVTTSRARVGCGVRSSPPSTRRRPGDAARRAPRTSSAWSSSDLSQNRPGSPPPWSCRHRARPWVSRFSLPSVGPSRGRASVSARSSGPTSTRARRLTRKATLDAIQASLASHAAAALAAFDASLGCSPVDDPRRSQLRSPSRSTFPSESPGPHALPQRRVGGGVRRS